MIIDRKKRYFFVLYIIVVFSISIQAQEMGSFTDKRDGRLYETVAYSIQLSQDSIVHIRWMAENLNYKIEDSYCFDDYESNCEIMGRLYNWPAAMNACPDGWHLPNDEEWYLLANLYKGISNAGIHLKSNSELWQRGGQGTNKSLFNVMPYGNGVKKNGYYGFKINGIFWSSDEKNETHAWDWKLVAGWKKIQRWEGQKETILNSVRCVQNGFNKVLKTQRNRFSHCFAIAILEYSSKYSW
ncbi:MAG: FISUMP domain-containing protein [Bacteroidota bacterium]